MLLQVMFMAVLLVVFFGGGGSSVGVVVMAVIGYGDVKPFADNGLVEYFVSLLHPSGCTS